MIEPDVASDLPELDHTEDPRGGAVAWALLTTGAVVIGSIFSAVVWAW